MQQPEAQVVLQAAARRVYGADSHVKYTLLKKLLQGMHDPNDPSTAPAFSLVEAAAVCHVPASALLAVLRSDTCFRVKQSQSSGSHSVGLHAAALLEKGRQSTKAGILVEELPEPVDWVDNVHPVRPGRPVCYHWERHSRCAFGDLCVYTHTEETHGAFKSQPRSRNQSPSPLGWSQQAPASTKATGSKQQGASSSQRGSSKAAAVSESPEFDSPQFGGAETHTGFEDVDARAAVLAPFGPTGNSSQPSSQGGWAAVAAGRHRPKQQQVPAAAPAAVPAALPAAVPAGTAAAHHVRPGGASRPGAATCRLFQIRGFCPQGASCPFDHPSSNSSAAPAAAAAQQGDTQQQQQQQQAHTTSAASSHSHSPLPAHLQQHEPLEEQWGEWAADSEQQQQQGTAAKKEHKRLFPSMGVNEAGLPMYRGAPNCAFYLGAGRCDFGARCKLHHPSDVMLPESALKGVGGRRFDASKSASYSRLVNHLQRLWDYEACEEAQLKVWLAHHLLARENTGRSMFSPDAALPAVEEDSRSVHPSPDKPAGAYSCTLKEAAQVLQLLWKAQPDEAANTPFPYTGRLGSLLRGDAYLQLRVDSGQVVGVKLRVGDIKRLLNF